MAAASYSVQIVNGRQEFIFGKMRGERSYPPFAFLRVQFILFRWKYNVPRVERTWTVTVTVTVKGDRVEAVIAGASTSGWGSDAPHDVTGMCRVVGYR